MFISVACRNGGGYATLCPSEGGHILWFHENLKALRKDRGLSQEELAVRLNVVRQTISKWEKGLSVPDAAMLIRLAEVLDTTVSRLLGADVPEDEADRDRLAEQLARINEQLAVRNRRGRFILRLVLGILAAFVVVNLLLILFSYGAFRAFQEPVQTITSAPELLLPNGT